MLPIPTTSRSEKSLHSSGNVYGADTANHRISEGIPAQVTGPVLSIVNENAVVTGSADSYGLAATIWFEYGTSTSYGHQTAAKSIAGGTNFVVLTGTFPNLTPNIQRQPSLRD